MKTPDRLRRVMDEAGDIPFVILDEVSYPWSWVRRLDEVLAAAVGESDPSGRSAAIVLRNRPLGLGAVVSTLAARRCAILISPIQPTASLCAMVKRLRPSLLIAESEDWSPELDATLAEVGTAGLELRNEEGAPRVVPRKGLGRAGPGLEGDIAEDVAILSPTSGTTGAAKFSPHTWASLDRHIPADEEPIKPRAVLVTAIPLYTAGGLTVLRVCMLRPQTLALLERLDVRKWADLIATYKPRLAGLPPAGMQMLLDADIPKEKFASLQAWNTGAAPVPPELVDGLEARYGIPVLVTYGATEFGQIAQWSLESKKAFGKSKRGSCGQAMPGRELRVVDPQTGEALPVGATGILEVHTPHYQSPDGSYWMRTTDLAHIDADGFLFIDGRADDVIIRGGFKVPLFALEATVREHPDVSACAAVGLPDQRLGQVPAIAVVLRPEARGRTDEAALVAWLRERVPPYQVPTQVKILEAMPLSAAMKVSRPEVKALFT